ncbi:MAG: hypothetical protein PF518_18410 [Spirochaetaceae bacterium]|nr:hypothetical protein [Spirochaetaceae bacterium]
MNKGDIFLNKVREITMTHLNLVAQETGNLFKKSLPERIGSVKLYSFLQENYAMDEVQQISACYIRLFNRDYEEGQFMFTETEFEGMKRLLVFFRKELPIEDVQYIGELIRILDKGSAEQNRK